MRLVVTIVVTVGVQLATLVVLLLGLEAFRDGQVSGPVMVMLARLAVPLVICMCK